MSYCRKTIIKVAFLILPLALISCTSTSLEFWRQVPIQIARVTQTESYQQTFRISTPSIKKVDLPERNRLLDTRMDAIFTSMIGSRNWQYLKNLYGVSDIRNEFMRGEIHMDGLMNFVVYLDPSDINYVVIEGTGRYFALRDKTDAILMSGDFHILPQRYSLKLFSSGCIPLDVKLYTTRIPGKTTFYKPALMRYDLNIDTTNNSTNTYSIKYENDHLAYLDMDNDGTYDKENELVASLSMKKTRYPQVKLFDLSGLLFIKKDYTVSKKAELGSIIASESEGQRQCVINSKPANIKEPGPTEE